MEAVDRINQAIGYLKYKREPASQMAIAKKTGRDRTNISKAINGDKNYLTEQFLKDFASAYSDFFNEDWIVRGIGDMKKTDSLMRPHFETKASAGFMDAISEGNAEVEMRPFIPGMKDYTFTIRADGNSMLPRIESGDFLICRMLNDRLNPPIGKICVVDTVDGVFVKQITEANDETVTLHSLNPAHSDRVVQATSILGIALVVASFREY